MASSVETKTFDNRTRGMSTVWEEFESGASEKWGLKGAFFNVLVSKNSRDSYGNFAFDPSVRYLLLGEWSASLFASSATFCFLFMKQSGVVFDPTHLVCRD